MSMAQVGRSSLVFHISLNYYLDLVMQSGNPSTHLLIDERDWSSTIKKVVSWAVYACKKDQGKHWCVTHALRVIPAKVKDVRCADHAKMSLHFYCSKHIHCLLTPCSFKHHAT